MAKVLYLVRSTPPSPHTFSTKQLVCARLDPFSKVPSLAVVDSMGELTYLTLEPSVQLRASFQLHVSLEAQDPTIPKQRLTKGWTAFEFTLSRPGQLLLSQEKSNKIMFACLPVGDSIEEQVLFFGTHPGDVRCIARTSDLLISGCSAGCLQAWRLEDGREVGKQLDAHGPGVHITAVAIVADDMAASGSAAGDVLLWRMDDAGLAPLQRLVTSAAAAGPVRALAVAAPSDCSQQSANAWQLAVLGGELQVWAWEGHESAPWQLQAAMEHPHLHCCSFLPGSQSLAVGAGDIGSGWLLLYNSTTLHTLQQWAFPYPPLFAHIWSSPSSPQLGDLSPADGPARICVTCCQGLPEVLLSHDTGLNGVPLGGPATPPQPEEAHHLTMPPSGVVLPGVADTGLQYDGRMEGVCVNAMVTQGGDQTNLVESKRAVIDVQHAGRPRRVAGAEVMTVQHLDSITTREQVHMLPDPTAGLVEHSGDAWQEGREPPVAVRQTGHSQSDMPTPFARGQFPGHLGGSYSLIGSAQAAQQQHSTHSIHTTQSAPFSRPASSASSRGDYRERAMALGPHSSHSSSGRASFQGHDPVYGAYAAQSVPTEYHRVPDAIGSRHPIGGHFGPLPDGHQGSQPASIGPMDAIVGRRSFQGHDHTALHTHRSRSAAPPRDLARTGSGAWSPSLQYRASQDYSSTYPGDRPHSYEETAHPHTPEFDASWAAPRLGAHVSPDVTHGILNDPRGSPFNTQANPTDLYGNTSYLQADPADPSWLRKQMSEPTQAQSQMIHTHSLTSYEDIECRSRTPRRAEQHQRPELVIQQRSTPVPASPFASYNYEEEGNLRGSRSSLPSPATSVIPPWATSESDSPAAQVRSSRVRRRSPHLDGTYGVVPPYATTDAEPINRQSTSYQQMFTNPSSRPSSSGTMQRQHTANQAGGVSGREDFSSSQTLANTDPHASVHASHSTGLPDSQHHSGDKHSNHMGISRHPGDLPPERQSSHVGFHRNPQMIAETMQRESLPHNGPIDQHHLPVGDTSNRLPQSAPRSTWSTPVSNQDPSRFTHGGGGVSGCSRDTWFGEAHLSGMGEGSDCVSGLGDEGALPSNSTFVTQTSELASIPNRLLPSRIQSLPAPTLYHDDDESRTAYQAGRLSPVPMLPLPLASPGPAVGTAAVGPWGSHLSGAPISGKSVSSLGSEQALEADSTLMHFTPRPDTIPQPDTSPLATELLALPSPSPRPGASATARDSLYPAQPESTSLVHEFPPLPAFPVLRTGLDKSAVNAADDFSSTDMRQATTSNTDQHTNILSMTGEVKKDSGLFGMTLDDVPPSMDGLVALQENDVHEQYLVPGSMSDLAVDPALLVDMAADLIDSGANNTMASMSSTSSGMSNHTSPWHIIRQQGGQEATEVQQLKPSSACNTESRGVSFSLAPVYDANSETASFAVQPSSLTGKTPKTMPSFRSWAISQLASKKPPNLNELVSSFDSPVRDYLSENLSSLGIGQASGSLPGAKGRSPASLRAQGAGQGTSPLRNRQTAGQEAYGDEARQALSKESTDQLNKAIEEAYDLLVVGTGGALMSLEEDDLPLPRQLPSLLTKRTPAAAANAAARSHVPALNPGPLNPPTRTESVQQPHLSQQSQEHTSSAWGTSSIAHRSNQAADEAMAGGQTSNTASKHPSQGTSSYTEDILDEMSFKDMNAAEVLEAAIRDARSHLQEATQDLSATNTSSLQYSLQPSAQSPVLAARPGGAGESLSRPRASGLRSSLDNLKQARHKQAGMRRESGNGFPHTQRQVSEMEDIGQQQGRIVYGEDGRTVRDIAGIVQRHVVYGENGNSTSAASGAQEGGAFYAATPHARPVNLETIQGQAAWAPRGSNRLEDVGDMQRQVGSVEDTPHSQASDVTGMMQKMQNMSLQGGWGPPAGGQLRSNPSQPPSMQDADFSHKSGRLTHPQQQSVWEYSPAGPEPHTNATVMSGPGTQSHSQPQPQPQHAVGQQFSAQTASRTKLSMPRATSPVLSQQLAPRRGGPNPPRTSASPLRQDIHQVADQDGRFLPQTWTKSSHSQQPSKTASLLPQTASRDQNAKGSKPPLVQPAWAEGLNSSDEEDIDVEQELAAWKAGRAAAQQRGSHEERERERLHLNEEAIGDVVHTSISVRGDHLGPGTPFSSQLLARKIERVEAERAAPADPEQVRQLAAKMANLNIPRGVSKYKDLQPLQEDEGEGELVRQLPKQLHPAWVANRKLKPDLTHLWNPDDFTQEVCDTAPYLLPLPELTPEGTAQDMLRLYP